MLLSFSELYSADWNSKTIYRKGDLVTHNDKQYSANWWTQGDNPAKSGKWGPWTEIKSNSKEDSNSNTQWQSNQVYTKGDSVLYDGNKYTAKWWTQGDNPAKSGEWGPWQHNGKSQQDNKEDSKKPEKIYIDANCDSEDDCKKLQKINNISKNLGIIHQQQD